MLNPGRLCRFDFQKFETNGLEEFYDEQVYSPQYVKDMQRISEINRIVKFSEMVYE